MPPLNFAPGLVIQRITPPLRWADFRVMAFDMDSTLINIECIDEVADAAGKKAEVAAITEAAMRGDITNFTDSLKRRVAMLRGVPMSFLEEVYAQRLQLNPGADELLRTAQAAGLTCMLVSGGFTFFAERVQQRLRLDEAHANVLGVDADGRLTGEVIGPVVDGAMKREHLLSLCHRVGCSPSQAIAVGDGANDLPMMQAAGLSVAYHAKPKVSEHANVAITQGGLDRLLELLQA